MTRFNECAHRYGHYTIVQRQMVEWLVAWLGGVACPQGRVLDYGAGEGLFTRHLAPYFTEVYAVDQAPCMVQLGRKRVHNAHWMEGDAWRGDGPDRRVDTIVSASLLQWCEEPEEVLRRWRARLVPGGRLLLGFYVDPTLPELGHFLKSEVMPLQWRNVASWESLLKRAGFVIERSECRTRSLFFRDSLELLRQLHGTGAVNQGRLGPGRLRTVLREYDQRFCDAQNRVVSSWSFYRIQAVLADERLTSFGYDSNGLYSSRLKMPDRSPPLPLPAAGRYNSETMRPCTASNPKSSFQSR